MLATQFSALRKTLVSQAELMLVHQLHVMTVLATLRCAPPD